MTEMESSPVVEVILTAGPTLEVEVTGTGPMGPVGPRGPKGDRGDNGKDGRDGDGDMNAAVYDPQGKARDIFQYADDAADRVARSNGYSREETDEKLGGKADRAEDLAGYGILDAYTKGETDGLLGALGESMDDALDGLRQTFDSGLDRLRQDIQGSVDGAAGTAGAALEEARARVRLTTAAVTLTADGWEENRQTVMVEGVPADKDGNAVFPVSAPENWDAFAEAGIRCVEQRENSLTFVCDDVPDTELTIHVAIFQ